MRDPSKRVAQYLHARQRARQRYGLRLNWTDVDCIVKSIQQRRGATLIRRTGQRVAVWDVNWECQVVRVVYDRATRNLITFLPREADHDDRLSPG